jgi:pimeloyl-ACP methyl ester carboxylesterase
VKLHFDEEGDGPLVVLLHGFPQSRRTWKRSLHALADAGFRAVAPDLRGYGDSPKPRGIDEYRLPLLIDDVAELIESLGGAPCILVGHDWGAAIAWYLTMMRPELVRKLVVLNVPHPAAILREVRRSFRQKLRLLYQLFFRLPLLPELALRVLRVRGDLTPMLNYYRALPRSRGLGKHVRRIDIPVMIIWSEHEPVFLPSTIENLDDWMTNVRIERIAGAGHFVQRDEPERVSRLLIEFAL